MIPFKPNVTKLRPAFTLVEVLVALTIAALVLTPLFVSQSSLSGATLRYSWLFERVMQARQFLFESHRLAAPDTQNQEREKKIIRPPTTLKYSISKVPDNSALKNIRNLYVEKVTAEWPRGLPGTSQTQRTVIGRLLYKGNA